MAEKTFTEFTYASLAKVREQWLSDAVKYDYPVIDFDKVFSYAADHINYEDVKNDSLSYALFNDDQSECLAVVDVVVSNNNPQKTFIKMLTVDLCPRLLHIVDSSQMDKLEEILVVYAKSTLGTIQLTSLHKANIIKLYGRTLAMRHLLKALELHLNENASIDVTTKWEGFWLTISPNHLHKKGKK